MKTTVALSFFIVAGSCVSALAAPPPPPILYQPAQGAINVPITKQLIWSPEGFADSNHYQVATDSLFSKIVVDGKIRGGGGETYPTIGPLQYNTTYYWHVNSSNPQGVGPYSATFHFTTVASTAINPPGYSAYRLTISNGDILRFSIPQKSAVQIQVFNSKGIVVKTLMNEKREKGYYSVPLPKGYLNNGYFLKFKTDGFRKVLRLGN